MAAPVGAQPTGEQALLNRTKAAVAERRDVGAAVDGAWALLNRPSDGHVSVHPEAAFAASFHDARGIDGRRALLGTPKSLVTPANAALK